MIISHSLRYIYLAVPKTASTSVSNILIDQFEGERYGGHHNVLAPDGCADYFKFCTVRHPHTRARSLFFHARRVAKHRCHSIAQGTFYEYLKWLADVLVEPSLFVNQNDYRQKISSGLLEKSFYQESINKRYGRDLNQVDYISYFFGLNYVDRMDYIIRMENLEDEFQKLPFVGKSKFVDIPKANVSKNKWDVSMKDGNKDLIYQWSKDDFFAFNYGRDI